MKIRKSIYLFLFAVVMLVACGEKGQKKEATVDLNEEIKIIGETSQQKELQELRKEKAERIKESNKEDIVVLEQKESLADSTNVQANGQQSDKPNTTKPSTSKPTTGQSSTPQQSNPVVSVPATPDTKVCEHNYEPEFWEYDYIKHYVYGCNGCGYPLFTLSANDAVNLPNLYVHPECETDRFEGMCTGGAYHSEMYIRGFCAYCQGEFIRRQCMFSVMGLRCVKNEALGPYEKVEEGQNPSAFIKSCTCGENQLMVGSNGKGVCIVKETCIYCNDVITYSNTK